VDEAQDLEGSTLETIRLLSDFETTHAKLLEIVLAGQPQLAEKLAQRGLSQLRQRIAILSRLEPLSADETACYIEIGSRWLAIPAVALRAGCLGAIAEQSQGIPREINTICFNGSAIGGGPKTPNNQREIAREAKEHQTIGAEIARVVLPNNRRFDRAATTDRRGPPAMAPCQTSPPSLTLGTHLSSLRQEINDFDRAPCLRVV